MPLIDVTYVGTVGEQALRRLGELRPDVVGEAVECPEEPFPLDTGIDTKLTAQDKAYGSFYTVKSLGILLLPRSVASTEH